jgi:hypothetical protein
MDEGIVDFHHPFSTEVKPRILLNSPLAKEKRQVLY